MREQNTIWGRVSKFPAERGAAGIVKEYQRDLERKSVSRFTQHHMDSAMDRMSLFPRRTHHLENPWRSLSKGLACTHFGFSSHALFIGSPWSEAFWEPIAISRARQDSGLDQSSGRKSRTGCTLGLFWRTQILSWIRSVNEILSWIRSYPADNWKWSCFNLQLSELWKGSNS